jgi:DNA-binding transcriptional MerR regulator
MYTIKQAADIMNISAHTLRFYAKNDMFPFITRDYNNIRQFSDKDLEWVKLVKCLRDTGMPLEEVKKYIELCKAGDATIGERYRMILEQKKKALEQMKDLQNSIDLLSYKAEMYGSFIKEGRDRCNPATASLPLGDRKKTAAPAAGKNGNIRRTPLLKANARRK